MHILINGERHETAHSQLHTLLNEVTDTNLPFAVAINEQFIAKSNYSDTQLSEGDRIEIVSPMQGG